jgi:hypothetical protein
MTKHQESKPNISKEASATNKTTGQSPVMLRLNPGQTRSGRVITIPVYLLQQFVSFLVRTIDKSVMV